MSCGPPVARAGGLAAVRAAPRDAYSFIEGRRAATVGAHPAPTALPGRPPTSGNAPRTDECRVWCHVGHKPDKRPLDERQRARDRCPRPDHRELVPLDAAVSARTSAHAERTTT